MLIASGANKSIDHWKLGPSFYFGLIPVLLLTILLISFRLFLHSVRVFEPHFLLPAFNTFLFVASSLIAFIGLNSYLLNGAATMLWLGCGVLTLGTGALAAGWLLAPLGANVNVTIFNVAVLLSSICHVGALLVTLEGKAGEANRARRVRKAVLGYLAVLSMVAILVGLTVAGLMPQFFIQGQGPTVTRQYAVEWAIVLFAFSSLVIMHRFLHRRVPFLYWYSLALGLVALSMLAFFMQPAVGSPIGWLGRISYVVAAVYFLISVNSAWREARTRGLGLHQAMIALLGPGRLWPEILGAVSDAVVAADPRGKILLWNQAAERIFGLPEGEVVGKGLDLILPAPEALYDLGLGGGTAEVQMKRQDGSGFSAEVSSSVHDSPIGQVVTLIVRDISARKQAEAALRESEQHYRSLFDNMLNGLAYCQMIFEDGNRPVDFIFLNVNPIFELLIGSKEIIGKKVSEVIPRLRESDPQVLELFGRVVVTGSPDWFETYVKSLGMWFSISVYSPQPEHFVAVFDLITRRKQAEAALKRQHAILAAINRIFKESLICETEEQLGETCLAVAQELTGSKFGFIGKLNEDGRLDDLAISYLGWEACKIAGKEELVLPRNLHVHGIYGVCLREGRSEIANDPASHSERVGVPEGHPPITRFLGVPLKQGGKTIGMIGLGNKEGDYTLADQNAVEALAVAVGEAIMRKRAEVEVRRQASFPLMNPSPVIEIDASGAITFSNPAATELLARIGPEVKLSDLLPEDLEEINLAARQKNERIFYREVRVNDWVFGQNIHFAEPFDVLRIYSLDITERQRAEERLAKAMADLARSNKDLEEFAYIASHDLQEPLRKMASFSEILASRYQGQLDERADKYIGYIIDGAQRMRALINDLLSLSRVGRSEFILIPTDMNDVLRRTLEDLHPLILESQAEITHELLPTLQVNPPQMGQLIQNLIANAIKFHGDQPPRVHITASQKGQEWLMAVGDNGIGFEPRFAERIFKVFQRLHARDEYRGTGIGLAICKKIVERHGGRIWAESAPGRGATFYFTIPA